MEIMESTDRGVDGTRGTGLGGDCSAIAIDVQELACGSLLAQTSRKIEQSRQWNDQF